LPKNQPKERKKKKKKAEIARTPHGRANKQQEKKKGSGDEGPMKTGNFFLAWKGKEG